ncbi:MAG: FCD domain-containing protein [Chloroflexi bacterium]|nr:FCD domain-containing protein [Chloroflexota bacterium]
MTVGIDVAGTTEWLQGTVAKPRPLTLREHAVEAIRHAIISGALRPGERIREDELAEKLGTSRGPVREAVRALEQEGLIRSEPHRASYVATLAEEEVWEIYRVRAEVEAIAARRVAEAVAADPARINPYQLLLERMRRAAAAGDLSTLNAADLDLHQLILEDSGYTHLPRVWATMDGIIRAQASAILAEQPHGEIVDYTAESHDPIVAALATGDPERAAAAVRAHILETRDLWQRVRRRLPLREAE